MRARTALLPYAVSFALFLVAQRFLQDDVAIASAAIVVAMLQIIWRPISATLLVLPVVAAISTANTIKFEYTGETLIWQDLAYALPNLGNNLGALLQYVDLLGLLALVGWIGVLVLAACVERRRLSRTRADGAIFAAILLLVFSQSIVATIDEAAALTHEDVNAWTFSGHRPSPSALERFIRSTRIASADFVYAPVGAGEYETRAASVSSPEVHDPGRKPDVIVILQESQFDPRQLAACESRADCRLDMFEPGARSRQFGPLRVHVKGGGTWNSELALMTGTDHHWFSRTAYAPYTVAPRIRHALGHQFRALGYRTAVVYPVQKGMMNAFNAYRAYGMEAFFGAEALALSTSWCDVTDDVMYAKLAEVRERLLGSDEQPLFLLMLTINNHGPHGKKCARPENVISSGDSPEQQLSKKVEDYIERSIASDRASRAFRESVLNSKRPSLILVFGDHQPSFEGVADRMPRLPHRPMSDEEALHFANYQFFSNVGNHSPPVRRELDVVFLPSTLLELAGLPLGPVFDANLRLRKICDGRLDQCPGGSFLDSYRDHLMTTGFYR